MFPYNMVPMSPGKNRLGSPSEEVAKVYSSSSLLTCHGLVEGSRGSGGTGSSHSRTKEM